MYGFVAVRPNGDLSFSCNMGNPYLFGKAYESIKIPVDAKLRRLLLKWLVRCNTVSFFSSLRKTSHYYC